MNERWSYQVRRGILFAVAIAIFNAIMNYNKALFLEQFYAPKFYIKFLILLVFSIFVIGYFDWKGKNGKEYKWSDLFKKNKK